MRSKKRKRPPPTESRGEAEQTPIAVSVERRAVPVPERQQPALVRFVQGLRSAAGAVLDIADALADAITKRIEGRA